MGRALTGDMPADPTTDDFKVFTAGLNTYVRRGTETEMDGDEDVGRISGRKVPDWRGGKGVRGGWDCVGNGECGFLSGGAERGWYVYYFPACLA